MTDTTHLDALQLSLSNERDRLARATNPQEIALRKVWVSQYERQIADEMDCLGIAAQPEIEMDDEALLAELGL